MIPVEKEMKRFKQMWRLEKKTIKINCFNNLEYKETEKVKLKMGYHLKFLLHYLQYVNFVV